MSAAPIPFVEFADRRERAAKEARTRGLDGLIVWSRQGPTLDWYCDTFYFTNYHCAIGQLQDTHIWAGRGHNVLILPADGEATLVVDLPDYRAGEVRLEDVRFSMNVPRAVAGVLQEKKLDRARLGLAGRETLLLHTHQLVEEALGHNLVFEPADDIVEKLRIVKSASEIELIRHAVDVGSEALRIMMEAIAPGVTEGDLVGEGLRSFASQRGRPFDIAITSGATSHHYWTPGPPPHWDASRKLENGDLVHIDLWGPVEGYYMDFARSSVVGGKPSSRQHEVLEATIGAVEHVLAGVRPGVTAGELFARGAEYQADQGFASDDPEGLQSFCPCFGHGIGLGLENPWIIADETTLLEPNMTVAVEAMFAQPGLGANFEHDILVTDAGYEILDANCPDRWWE